MRKPGAIASRTTLMWLIRVIASLAVGALAYADWGRGPDGGSDNLPIVAALGGLAFYALLLISTRRQLKVGEGKIILETMMVAAGGAVVAALMIYAAIDRNWISDGSYLTLWAPA